MNTFWLIFSRFYNCWRMFSWVYYFPQSDTFILFIHFKPLSHPKGAASESLDHKATQRVSLLNWNCRRLFGDQTLDFWVYCTILHMVLGIELRREQRVCVWIEKIAERYKEMRKKSVFTKTFGRHIESNIFLFDNTLDVHFDFQLWGR